MGTGIGAPGEGELRDTAIQNMFAYLRPIIAERVANPADDVFSKRVSGTYEGRPLSVDEMLGLSATILVGGLDTVAALLGFVARYLAENPQSRQMLREGDVKMNAAIDEFLRRYPPTTSGRQVVVDVEFHGVQIDRKDYITCSGGLNRKSVG